MTKTIKECCEKCIGIDGTEDGGSFEYCQNRVCPCHFPVPEPAEGEKKYCVVAPEYGKDELKQLHFYCQNCGKEILKDKQICSPSENEGWRERFDSIVNKIFLEFPLSTINGRVWSDKIAPKFRELLELISQEIKEAEARGVEKGYVARGAFEGAEKATIILNYKDKIIQARQETLAEIQKFVEGMDEYVASDPDESPMIIKKAILSYLADKINQLKKGE